MKTFRAAVRPLALLLALVGLAAADKVANYVIKNFAAVLKNHDAPYDTQIESLLEGTEAEPQPGGLILIRGLKLQTFATNGTTELIVRSPHCIFDTKERSVSSDGHLEVRSGDGQFFFEGEGFLVQTNSNLHISNRVHTVIRNLPKTATQP